MQWHVEKQKHLIVKYLSVCVVPEIICVALKIAIKCQKSHMKISYIMSKVLPFDHLGMLCKVFLEQLLKYLLSYQRLTLPA